MAHVSQTLEPPVSSAHSFDSAEERVYVWRAVARRKLQNVGRCGLLLLHCPENFVRLLSDQHEHEGETLCFVDPRRVSRSKEQYPVVFVEWARLPREVAGRQYDDEVIIRLLQIRQRERCE